MRSLVFGKRWRKTEEGTSGKNDTDCSGKKKNPPKARETDFGRWRSGLSLGKEIPPKARKEDFREVRSILFGEKEIPPKAREEDFHGGRSVMFGEKERGDLGKVSFRCGKCSALHVLAQHAASAGAARCVSHRTALRFSPHPSPSCPKAPSPSPPSASLLPCPRAGHHREGQ